MASLLEAKISKALDHKTIANVAQILDKAAIPAVLWGDCMLDALGIPTPIKNISFIVPDDKLDDAADALFGGLLKRCCRRDEDLDCPRWDASQPLAAVHFHLLPHYPQAGLTLELYRKSSLLWTFPSLPRSMGTSTSEYLMYTADEQLPRSCLSLAKGCYAGGLYPVKIPRPVKLIEALLLLHSRELRSSVYNDPWIQWLGWLKDYVVDIGLVPVDRIAERFQPLWREVLDGTNGHFYDLLEALDEEGSSQGTV